MLISLIFAFFGIISFGEFVKAQDSSIEEACQSWANLKKEAENFSEDVRLLCTINDYCTGVSCDGKYENYKGKLEVMIHHCSLPVSVEVHLSVPKLEIHDWSQTFVHGDSVPIPTTGPQSDNDKSFIEVYLAPIGDRSSVTFGVSIVSSSLLGHGGNPISVVLLKNETVKFPPCPDKKVDLALLRTVSEAHVSAVLPIHRSMDNKDFAVRTVENESNGKELPGSKACSLTTLTSCSYGEICELKTAVDSIGVCNCVPTFYRDSNGICQPIPSVPSSTPSPNPVTPQAGVAPVQSPSQTALSIAVPVILLIVLSTLVVLAYKFRWINRLRARFMPIRRYEEMVIDGDEVGNMQSESSDPVA